jgi:hypothetical protein
MHDYTTIETLFIAFTYLMPVWATIGVALAMSMDDAEFSLRPNKSESCRDSKKNT